MPSIPGTANFPAALDDATSLFSRFNNAATTLSVALAIGDTTASVASTTGFPSSGAISIESEVIYYTGKTGTTFTGLLRGMETAQGGTAAVAHPINTAVEQRI